MLESDGDEVKDGEAAIRVLVEGLVAEVARRRTFLPSRMATMSRHAVAGSVKAQIQENPRLGEDSAKVLLRMRSSKPEGGSAAE
jgi:hypothetical protein